MDLIEHLDRVEILKMKAWELDAGFSLSLGQPTRLATGSTHAVEALRDGEWRPFSPTTSWDDFGSAVSRFGMVLGTHGGEEGAPRWYSAHSYVGGTSFDSTSDLRLAAAQSATAYGKLMGWRMAADPDAAAPRR